MHLPPCHERQRCAICGRYWEEVDVISQTDWPEGWVAVSDVGHGLCLSGETHEQGLLLPDILGDRRMVVLEVDDDDY